MKIDLINLKETLSSDKRKSDRMQLPVKLSYALGDSLEILPKEWIDPLEVIDIGGEGAKFLSEKSIKKDTSLILKINLPNYDKPIILTSEIIWSKKENIETSTDSAFSVGIKFNKMHYKDRKKFVSYLSDSILGLHLDDDGNLTI
ncbi:hypothetical protein MNBD_UNCLBAC01-832 [hydrothermal vent metagenome]|uniref:PilZ domain-containing protein n=1 Tax=hydrothermal vent metagenome TaxID=652676 RepID=A0A3B1DHC5_9ZZZZ